ncbi:MAG: leucine-rich repeat domain-containing protein [Saprospiraceae bacterium]|nr:leucine-rich repeat domain-containing protein [Saprospiraceae bacterium]
MSSSLHQSSPDIMESPTSSLLAEAQLTQASAWWDSLSDAWKQAFNEVAFRRSSTEPLGDEMLLTIFTSPNHRFAGPSAPFPNMTFELEDMSGLVGIPNMELAVVIHHKLTHIREAAAFKNLRSFFIHNNLITSLEGLEGLAGLKEIYCNVNQIDSLKPLEGLTNLHTLYCNYNLLSNLDGIGEQHADTLENFYGMPNPNLKESVAMRFEREVGIRCKKA